MYQFNQMPTEAQIRKVLRKVIFGENMFCPKCHSRKIIRYEKRYRCRECREKFSLLSHTWLSDMKLPLPKFWILLWCWASQMPIRQTEALLELSEDAVRRWYDRFRAKLPEETHILEHIVQLDEAFFKNQMVLIMGKEKGSRKLAYDIMAKHPERHHIGRFLFRKVKPGSKLWTDGASIYDKVSEWWPVKHKRDIHTKFQFKHTSEIEGIFGNYRTFTRRMYHHHRAENLEQYVREFCFRFSSPELFENPLFYLTKTLSLVPID